MKRLLILLIAGVIAFSALGGLGASSVAAQTTKSFEELQASPTGDGACVIDGVVTIRGVECLLRNVFSVAISGIGFAGFVMLIVGSFQYLMSGGNTKGVEGSRNTMTYAIVGLVVALSSWIILNFIATFTGVKTITTFSTFFGN